MEDKVKEEKLNRQKVILDRRDVINKIGKILCEEKMTYAQTMIVFEHMSELLKDFAVIQS